MNGLPFETAKLIAGILSVPVAYFYCPQEDLAQLLLAINEMTDEELQVVLAFVNSTLPEQV